MLKKTARLLKTIHGFLDEDERRRRREMATIKDLLKKLKKHQHELQSQAEDCQDHEAKQSLHTDIQIVRVQRKKALSALKHMRHS
jgi:hypothetical protein